MLRVIRAPWYVGVFLLMLVVMSASAAHGQTTSFTYQGQLSDAGALANASYDLRFALFDTLMGGAQIGANQDVPAVPVSAGVFTVQLDFGVNAFPGANRFVEISVKPAGVGSYTTLAPRQQISSSPYAIRTLSAATADALSSACVGCVTNTQIQDVAGSKVSGAIPAASVPSGSGNYIQNTTAQQASSNFNIAGNGVVGGNLTVAGTLNANVSGNFIQNRTTPQAGANFNVGGNGTVGGVLSAGNVGVGTTTPASKLDIAATGDGAELLRLSTDRPWVFRQISSGSTAGLELRSLVGQKPFEITSVEGVNVATFFADGANSRVGIGITNPTSGRLHVVGTVGPAIYGESSNRGVWGRSTGASRGVYGDSVSGEGVHGESTSGTGVAGVSHGPDAAAVVGINDTGGNGVFGQSGGGVVDIGFAMVADGHAKQTREKGGWAKAMASVRADGLILECYNSQKLPRAAGDCGMSVDHSGTGLYNVVFGFNVADRFVSATAIDDSGFVEGPYAGLIRSTDTNAWGVQTRISFGGGVLRDSSFMIVVY